MRKINSLFLQSTIIQFFLLLIGLPVLFVLYVIIDDAISYSIGPDTRLYYMHNMYFKVGRYLLLAVFAFLVMLLSFIIQRRYIKKYHNYLVSGIKYLNGEIKDLEPFHESMLDEMLAIIELRKQHLEIKERCEKVYKEKTDLLTYLAHDIKTPISNLMGYTQLLYDEEDLTKEQQKRFIEVIYNNTRYLNRMSEDFFSYLKFNLNEIPLNISKIKVETFFAQWIEERKITFSDNSLKLNLNNTKDKEVKTDPELLLRVVDNLLKNASNYSIKGTDINICVNVKNKLSITISNIVENNLYVDWNQAKSIFYRGDISRNRLINSGSGVGLAIVNDIVKHLDGKFEIKKVENRVYAKIILNI